MSSDTFTKYGNSFQSKIIASLLTDKAFLQQILEIMDVNYFESDSNKWIVTTIKDYFFEFKDFPTLEVFKVKIEDIDVDVMQVTTIEQLKEVWKHIDSPDLDFVKTKALDFCKNQHLKNAIMESVDLLQSGQYDDIKTLIDSAMKAGTEKDIGHIYMEDIEIRYSDSVRSPVETPWETINGILDGGLGSGELGVLVAPAGVGKSWGLVNVGAHALLKGLNVVHYTLELNEAYTGLRYDSRITGIASQNLKWHKDEVDDKLKDIKGNLVIKYFPTKTATVNTIEAHIERMTLHGTKPDIVILDYADLLRGHLKGGMDKRHILENIYEDLRGLAGEREMPVWTASQANRSSLEMDIIEADKIAESYSKIMVADFVMSLSRKVTDKIANTGRWHIIKNRFGPDGLTFPSQMNTSTGLIVIHDEMSVSGKEQQKKMNNSNEYLRKMLSKKFNDGD